MARQRELAVAFAPPVAVDPGSAVLGGCWVCFPRGLAGPGTDQDLAWCAALTMAGKEVVEQRLITGTAGAGYVPGLLALRVGRLMEEAVRGLAGRPDVLLLDATSRDHPRRAGLAYQLGAELDLPTVGVTHRPLLALGTWPDDQRGATSPLRIGDEIVGCWLRTRAGARPLAIHPGWRVDLGTAVSVIMSYARGRRTPEPLRRARQLARRERHSGRGPI